MAKIDKSVGEVHPKRWGEEIWIENGPEYCGKILSFYDKAPICVVSTSMHFHMKKLETMLVLKGGLYIDLIDPETAEMYSVTLDVGEKIQIPRGQPHKLIAKVDGTQIIEFSTEHFENDSYRVMK